VLCYNSTYFSNKIQKGKTCYSEEQVISMLEFLIDNICVSFGGLLIDKMSSIYLYVKLKALASWIFLSFTSFWRNSDSYEYKIKSARRGAQFVPIGMPTTLEFNDSGQLSTTIYDKRDDVNFKIIHFPNMCSNIPASPAYGVYISQLIRYARASSNNSDLVLEYKLFKRSNNANLLIALVQ
jgi:hypothetical protein